MERILGHERPQAFLQRALQSDRVHHAWIFSGPMGVGKVTTALELAKILLDPDASPDLTGLIRSDPDGRVAQLVDARTHPDLHVISKELALFSDNAQLRNRKLANIPVDVLRERVIGGKTGDDKHHDGPAYRTATLGHGKVFIIDEAELIDRIGQNALLKTLEEPPPRTYLILVTTRAEALLPTIVSRCQHVRFGPLDGAAMDEWLRRTETAVDPGERAWIMQFSEGAPGLAALAVQYGFAGWQRTLDPMLAELDAGRYPAAMGAAMGEMVESFATSWVKANKNASKDAANKDGARHVLGLLASHARDRLTAACERDANDPVAVRALSAIDRIRAAERHLASNVNLKQLFENLVVQLAQAPAPLSAM